MGNKAKPTTRETTVNLTPEQAAANAAAGEQLALFTGGLGGGSLTAPGGGQVSGFDPLQLQGQQDVLDATGAGRELARSGKRASDFLLGGTGADVLFASSNPALRERSQFIGDQAVQHATELGDALALRNEAVGAGQFGGSRHNLAKQKLAESTLRQALGAQAGLESRAFELGLGAIKDQQGLITALQNAQFAPGVAASGIGEVRQRQAEAERLAATGAESFEQIAPLLTAQQLAALGAGLSGGSTTATSGAPQGPGRLSSALAGGATGASVGSLFGPVGTGVGAAGGALLGLLTA